MVALALCSSTARAEGVGAVRYQLDASQETRLRAGREQYESVRREDGATRGCWEAAVRRLEAGCRLMDDAERSRLAVQFTNCHLQKSGLDTYECSAVMSVEACTKPMVDSPNSVAYNAYTHFFTHAESMCFYLQSEAFQKSSEAAVQALHASAQGTTDRLVSVQDQLGEVRGSQEEIKAEQAAALAAASQLLEGQRVASASLAELSTSQEAAFERAQSRLAKLGGESKSALEALRRGTEELGAKQRSMIGGLERVLSLQGSLLGEFLDIKTIVFYVCAVLLSLALTATPRTATARLPIFAMLTINVILERLLASYLGGAAASPETLHSVLSMCRRLTSTVCVVTLAYAALHHTDVGKRTLSALDELKTLHKQTTQQLQDKLDRLEKEAAAHRSRDSTLAALQSAALRSRHRRTSSPVHHASGGVTVVSAGGVRTIPLSAHHSLSPAGLSKRRATSPLVPSAGGGAVAHGAPVASSSPSCARDAHAADAAANCLAGALFSGGIDAAPPSKRSPPPPPPIDARPDLSKPPSPPSDAEDASAAIDAHQAAGGFPSMFTEGLAAAGRAVAELTAGATPQPRATRSRRSSTGVLGSGDTAEGSPRRSARIAKRKESFEPRS